MSLPKMCAKRKAPNKLPAEWRERSEIERRSETDNRSADCHEYFLNGGKERRKMPERRKSGERRDNWLRVGKWRGVSVFDE